MAMQGRTRVNYQADPTGCSPEHPLDLDPGHEAGEGKPPAYSRDQGGHDNSALVASVTDSAADLAALLSRCRTVLHRINMETSSAVWGIDWAETEADPCADLDQGVDLVVGRHNVARRLEWLRDMPGRHLITVRSEPVPDVWSPRSKTATSDRRLLDRGVSMREIYTAGSGLTARQHFALLGRHAMGIGVRLMPTVPTDLMIVDRAVAVLPVDPDRPDWALAVVRNRMWVRAAQHIADVCWSSATDHATAAAGFVPARVAGEVRTGPCVDGSVQAKAE